MIILTGCSPANIEYQNDELILSDKQYEICDSDWHPYGEAVSADGYITYKNDYDNIFVSIKNGLFSENTLYHLASDEYPGIEQENRIKQIDLVFQNETVTVDENCAVEISKLCSNEKINNQNLKKADLGSEFVFVNVYYSYYPAYQNEFLICKTYDGGFGIMFCDTEQNAKTFGTNVALQIDSDSLLNYLKNYY